MGISYKREGERIVGRYIKASDSRILEKIKMTDFSFKEICSTQVASLDNIRSNIMHTELHDAEEIHSCVKQHESIDLELRSPETIRPTLRPIDFTHEWNEIKERATKKRDLKMEDDDDFEFEMALKKMSSEDSDDSEDEQQETIEVQPNIESEEVDIAINDGSFKIRREEESTELGGLGDQINQLAVDSGLATNELSSNVKRVEKTPSAKKEDEFIPVNMAESDSFDSSESEASNEYKSKIDVKKEYALQLEDAYNEAKSRGYEEGFSHGEEKAAIQVQQNATEVVNNLGQVVGELEGLKKAILENTQENFYEIAQAVAESLVRREFSINPQSFAGVLRKAIADFVPGDSIKIAVHPDTFSKLMSIELEGLKDKLVKDENIQAGDFRIDSNLSVVDGNVKEMIQDLLEQADLDIFADKDDKAG